MSNEALPKVEFRDPITNRVVGLVANRQYLTDTGLFRRQTHSKDGTHYFVAYNPHDDILSAECFVFVTPSIPHSPDKFRWLAFNGPSPSDTSKIDEALTLFERLVAEQDG